MRGATSWTKLIVHFLAFQPTRPLRGATAFEYSIEPYYKISTHAPLAGRDQGRPKQLHGLHHFNPRAPCGARRGVRVTSAADQISTHAPLAGRDTIAPCAVLPRTISTHAPLAGRDRGVFFLLHAVIISTHAPLAGRDSKSVQITMHIFAITDKFQMLLHRMPPVRAFCSFLMQENHADFGCEQPK